MNTNGLSSAILNDVALDLVLNQLIATGIINASDISDARNNTMSKEKLETIPSRHPYAIYQGNDGRWHTHVRDTRYRDNRRQISKSTLEKLHLALYEHYTSFKFEPRKRAVTLESLYPEWNEFKSLHTQAESYITRLNSDFRKHYKGTKIANTPLTELTKPMLDEWAHRLVKEKELTHKAFTNIVTILNQELEYAIDLEIIESNPFKRVRVDRNMFKPVKKKTSRSQIFTKEEVQQFRELAWKDYHEKAKWYVLSPLAALFMFLTGVRIGEVVALKWCDLEEPGMIHIQRMYRRDSRKVVETTKGTYGDRFVPLVSEAKEILAEARKVQEESDSGPSEFIFSTNEKPVSYYSVSDLFRKYSEKMGIELKSSHKARKTFISSCLDGQMNINTVREIVGHRDESTTYSSYYYDRSTTDIQLAQLENALKN